MRGIYLLKLRKTTALKKLFTRWVKFVLHVSIFRLRRFQLLQFASLSLIFFLSRYRIAVFISSACKIIKENEKELSRVFLYIPRGLAPLPAACWLPTAVWPARPPRGCPRWLLDLRWFAGSWPDSHRGGGTGFGAGGADFTAGEGLALTGMTDSSLALLVAGSCVSLPPAMLFISLAAATLVAFEVKWTPSLAQMLVPSTVAKSCKGSHADQKIREDLLFLPQR